MADPKPVPAVERSIELPASPERVWRAISDPEELACWFPDDTVDFEVEPGGGGWLYWSEHGRYRVEFDVVDPPRRLVWRWTSDPGVDPGRGPTTTVEWTIEALGEGRSRLDVRETGFATEGRRADNDQGWQEELAELRGYLLAAASGEIGIWLDLVVDAPPADVFPAVSTPEGLDAWWTERASGDAGGHAPWELGFGPAHTWQARVRGVDAPRWFELVMGTSDDDWQGTRIAFRLTPEGDGTRLSFSHTGWRERNGHYRTSGYCWAHYLAGLKAWVEAGRTVPYAERGG